MDTASEHDTVTCAKNDLLVSRDALPACLREAKWEIQVTMSDGTTDSRPSCDPCLSIFHGRHTRAKIVIRPLPVARLHVL